MCDSQQSASVVTPVVLPHSIWQQLFLLGFSQVGIAVPGRGFEEAFFEKWVFQGFHGQMGYLQKSLAKRLDPRRALSGVRSVLVLTYPYEPPTNTVGSYRVASYAKGVDYHRLLLKKQKKFLKWFRIHFPTEEIYFETDTGPILEKVWANRSGIGWMGKNTNVIIPKKGSYFFLSVLLTSLNLTPSKPTQDRCGNCTRCIEVCPTKAIVRPYVLDARRCISYLTIEHKGPIDRDLRVLIGDHLFGCDDCQTCCPWNRFASFSKDESLKEDPTLWKKTLKDFLKITPTQFMDWFQRSPIRRCQYPNFVRNVLIVTANLKRKEHTDLVFERCFDDDPIIRGHAFWALNQLDRERACCYLKEFKEKEQDPFVLGEMKEAFLY